ncbi:unnamed protein product, partial [Mesorhabditis spiculigera]
MGEKMESCLAGAALFAAFLEIAFTIASFGQMPGGISMNFSMMNSYTHVLFLAIAHVLTGRAVLAYRVGREDTTMSMVNDHASRHTLAILCIIVSYVALGHAGFRDSPPSYMMLIVQGLYFIMYLGTAVLSYFPKLFSDHLLSNGVKAHIQIGRIFWLLHSLQVLYSMYYFGRNAGNFGCIIFCSHNYETYFHMALLFTILATALIYYTLVHRPAPRVHLKESWEYGKGLIHTEHQNLARGSH